MTLLVFFVFGSFIEHQRTHSANQKAKAAALGSEGKSDTLLIYPNVSSGPFDSKQNPEF